MDAAGWDERYGTGELVWSATPNRVVEGELGALPPGRALDVACGEGRNAIWLAGLGWDVVGVDFSAVALDTARRLAEHAGVAPRTRWHVGDVTRDLPAGPFDVVLFCFLQLRADELRRTVERAVGALAPGGTLLLVAHDRRNLAEGTGGPQDPAVLYTAADVAAWLPPALMVLEAGVRERVVEGAARPALDAVLRAVSRPA